MALSPPLLQARTRRRSTPVDFWTIAAYVSGAYLVYLVYNHLPGSSHKAELPGRAVDRTGVRTHVHHIERSRGDEEARRTLRTRSSSRESDPTSGSGALRTGGGVVSRGFHLLDTFTQHSSPPSLPSYQWEDEEEQDLTDVDKTLRFQVCNGFANQRLSILYGMLLGIKLGRTVVLPTLVSEGTQHNTDFQVLAGPQNAAQFGDFYDTAFFIKTMAKQGLRVLTGGDDSPPPSEYTSIPLYPLGFAVLETLRSRYKDTPHISLDCPIFKLQAAEVPMSDSDFVWAVLDGLQPSAPLQRIVDATAHNIRKLTKQADFNFVHLRLEDDWLKHCRKWEGIRDSIVRNNCYNNTERMHNMLKLMCMPPTTPLYVGVHWPDVRPSLGERVMGLLKDANYSLITSALVLPTSQPLMREAQALVEYYLAMRAHKFIGNSVSSFSALLMLERRHHGLWATYYNGGNIPLTDFLPPLYRLPWVFTYNSWSPGYDYMLMAAVRSARVHQTLKPYCLFTGRNTSRIYRWLVSHNVTIITHTLTWKNQLLDKAEKHMKDNVQHSHLFKSPEMLIGTFQRIDMPVVPVLDQYHYVLYTDADVFFRKKVTLGDFALPLPNILSMGYEFRPDTYPHNAGIILMHLPELRRTYQAFVSFILTNKQGLHFGLYGPLDQGALNQFYEAELRSHLLPQAFNSKPYNGYTDDAAIVHFHGPKPHEYLQYLLKVGR